MNGLARASLLLLLLPSCADEADAPHAAGSAASGAAGPVESACGTSDDLALEILAVAEILLIGEIHGSNEPPEVALQMACAAAEIFPEVVLGLEIWSGEQARVDGFMKSNGDETARASLLSGSFWQTTEDGRSSFAMLELIDSVRREAASGSPLSILCFDAQDTLGATDRDAAMAQAVFADRASRPDARHVILTGNVHARTEVFHHPNGDLQPVGWHLDSQAAVRALKIRHSGGTSWACVPECGIQKFGGSGQPTARGIVRFDERDGLGYDGVIDVGPITASPPAVSMR